MLSVKKFDVKKQPVVLDSSVIVKFLFSEGEDHLDHADKLLRQSSQGSVDLIAPSLAKYEVGNVIRFRKLTDAEKRASWENLSGLPITFMEMGFRDGVRSLAIAESATMTFYDAVFVELASRLHATLVTANPKHQKKLRAVRVVALGDY